MSEITVNIDGNNFTAWVVNSDHLSSGSNLPDFVDAAVGSYDRYGCCIRMITDSLWAIDYSGNSSGAIAFGSNDNAILDNGGLLYVDGDTIKYIDAAKAKKYVPASVSYTNKLGRDDAIFDLGQIFRDKMFREWQNIRSNLDDMTTDDIVAMTDKFKLEMKNE